MIDPFGLKSMAGARRACQERRPGQYRPLEPQWLAHGIRTGCRRTEFVISR